MSRSVAALKSGLDYQARFFWAHAGVRLLSPGAPVSRVGFDVDDVDGFDDVVVERSHPDRDQFGRGVLRDYYQVKFHVDQTGDLTADSLTDPREIGGTKRSLLQRLKRAHEKLGDDASTSRLHLVSTYPIDRRDILAKLVSTNEGGVRMREFLAGGPRSNMGKLRAKWRDHLELETDDELEQLLRLLRIWHSAPTYRALQDELEVKFPAVGLRVPSGDGAPSPYEDLIWRLHGEETYYFDSEALRRECERAGLVEGEPAVQHRRPLVAVRSFRRPGIDLSDTADELLSLLEFFDGRFLQLERSWTALHRQLAPFFDGVTSRHRAFDLQIDTHASLAFAIGAQLQAKFGLELNILQFSRSGLEVWSTTRGARSLDADVAIEEFPIGRGNDVALVLAITHDIIDEVRQYAKRVALPIGRVVSVRPTAGSGQSAVRGGDHALAIADEISRVVKRRALIERQSELHLFAAAPNGLVFFLGQLSPHFGRVTLYEYDFEQTRTCGYEPSFSLPTPLRP